MELQTGPRRQKDVQARQTTTPLGAGKRALRAKLPTLQARWRLALEEAKGPRTKAMLSTPLTGALSKLKGQLGNPKIRREGRQCPLPPRKKQWREWARGVPGKQLRRRFPPGEREEEHLGGSQDWRGAASMALRR